MSQPEHPIVNFTYPDLQAMLDRCWRNILILGGVSALAVWIGGGWRSAVLLLVGTLISALSVKGWQRLVGILNARIDNEQAPRGTVSAVLFFFVKLALFAAVIYGSLKCVHGSVWALFYGLGLAVLALGWEALRLLRN